MSRLDKLPSYLSKPIFSKLFQIAAYSKLNQEERAMYDVSLKRKWDAEAMRQYQEQQLLKAREEGKVEIIEHMLSTTELTAKEIAALTNVSVDFVERIKAALPKK